MVCSVVVVVGFAGCTVVSSVVVLLVVRGSSEAQPESAPRTEARRQGSKSFFIILILLTGRHAPAHGSKRMQRAGLVANEVDPLVGLAEWR